MLRLAIGLTVLITLYNAGSHFGLKHLRANAETAVALQSVDQPVPEEVAALAQQWEGFKNEYTPTNKMMDQELSARAGSYESAFMWTAHHNTVILMSSLWSFLLPDALVMMILGMALYKLGVLQGQLCS